MITLKIDNKEIHVPEGTTVLDAAKSVGISIPSLCYKEGYSNHPSCMICLVMDRKTGNHFSSCAMKAAEGMDIISDNPEITEARKASLELLMSDHLGDCEAPCSLSCPANMNIPLMNRLIAAGKYADSLKVVKEMIALPYILGYICPAPCEKACRRKQIDNPVSICLLKRFAAAESTENFLPVIKSKTNRSKRVAIIGTGPAGLSSAWYLLLKGYQCMLFEKNSHAGGTLRTSINGTELPGHVLDAEVTLVKKAGAEFWYDTLITKENFESQIRTKFDAVILALGEISASRDLVSLFQNNNTGVQVDEVSYMTSLDGVFACGSVLRQQRMAVRTVMQGRETADAVDHYLQGNQLPKKHKMFNSRFDALEPEEYNEYLKESIHENRVQPEAGRLTGISEEEAISEAKRCLHCDCRKKDNCKLRRVSDDYHVDRKKYMLGERKKMTKSFQHEHLVYEPEKCIRCGLCVDITSKNKELTGLTFIGRGFDVRIDIPFSKQLSEAITHTAKECVESCPTGALAFKEVNES
jgi:NADPH-dependent glutamate synthase beta subunit-like oxidoreductase